MRRREVLAGAFSTFAVAAAPRAALARASDFGMGTDDDSDKLWKLRDMIAGGEIRRFVFDRVVTMKRPGRALEIVDAGGWRLDWVPGVGRLVMDNLDARGHGTGGAIHVSGTARGIELVNSDIAWARQPSARSEGDGILIKGRPSDGLGVGDIAFRGVTRIRWAPQTGCILLGCEAIGIEAIEAHETLADGLHLNACRDFRIGTVLSRATGDDGVGIVTYYSPTQDIPEDWRRAVTPWSLPDLGGWSNSDGWIGQVRAEGGLANGVRVSGALGPLRIDSIDCRDKVSALMLDGEQFELPGQIQWRYLASRGISVGTVTAEDCDAAVRIISRTGVASAFRQFDVEIAEIQARGLKGPAIDTRSSSGLRVGTVRENE